MSRRLLERRIVLPGLDAQGQLIWNSTPIDAFLPQLEQSLVGGNGQSRWQEAPVTANPLDGVWRLVLPGPGPQTDAILDALTPLTTARAAAAPLFYTPTDDGRPLEEQAQCWLQEHEDPLLNSRQKLLLVGDVDVLPFALQQVLAGVHQVGRIAFSSLEGLRTYAQRAAEAPVEARRPLLFAPDYDPPTQLSRAVLETQLPERLGMARDALHALVGNAATHAALLDALSDAVSRGGLAVLATHGLHPPTVPHASLGALLDQARSLLVPAQLGTRALLDRGILLMFSCDGGGFQPDSRMPPLRGFQPPVQQFGQLSPLALQLLERPEGPLAVLAHVNPLLDVAVLDALDRDEQRTPDSLDALLSVCEALWMGASVGDALLSFQMRTHSALQLLRLQLEEAQRTTSLTRDAQSSLLEAWMAFHDLRGWILLGDPATCLLPPAPSIQPA